MVQTTRDISFNTKLKLTTAKYYIPSGRCIQALDYTHRNVDGSVGKLPDSLKTAFKTKSGRTVYDGGGIDPDVAVERELYKDITYSLIRKNLIFKYATKYKFEHPTIADAKTFSISEKDYEDIFQDAFCKAIDSIRKGKYNEEGKFLPWIMMIANNLCMDHYNQISLP